MAADREESASTVTPTTDEDENDNAAVQSSLQKSDSCEIDNNSTSDNDRISISSGSTHSCLSAPPQSCIRPELKKQKSCLKQPENKRKSLATLLLLGKQKHRKSISFSDDDEGVYTLGLQDYTEEELEAAFVTPKETLRCVSKAKKIALAERDRREGDKGFMIRGLEKLIYPDHINENRQQGWAAIMRDGVFLEDDADLEMYHAISHECQCEALWFAERDAAFAKRYYADNSTSIGTGGDEEEDAPKGTRSESPPAPDGPPKRDLKTRQSRSEQRGGGRPTRHRSPLKRKADKQSTSALRMKLLPSWSSKKLLSISSHRQYELKPLFDKRSSSKGNWRSPPKRSVSAAASSGPAKQRQRPLPVTRPAPPKRHLSAPAPGSRQPQQQRPVQVTRVAPPQRQGSTPVSRQQRPSAARPNRTGPPQRQTSAPAAVSGQVKLSPPPPKRRHPSPPRRQGSAPAAVKGQVRLVPPPPKRPSPPKRQGSDPDKAPTKRQVRTTSPKRRPTAPQRVRSEPVMPHAGLQGNKKQISTPTSDNKTNPSATPDLPENPVENDSKLLSSPELNISLDEEAHNRKPKPEKQPKVQPDDAESKPTGEPTIQSDQAESTPTGEQRLSPKEPDSKQWVERVQSIRLSTSRENSPVKRRESPKHDLSAYENPSKPEALQSFQAEAAPMEEAGIAKGPLASSKPSQGKRVSTGEKCENSSSSPSPALPREENPSGQEILKSDRTEASRTNDGSITKKPFASPKILQNKRISSDEKVKTPSLSPQNTHSQGENLSKEQILKPGQPEAAPAAEKCVDKKPLASPKLSQSKSISAGEKAAKPSTRPEQEVSTDKAEDQMTSKSSSLAASAPTTAKKPWPSPKLTQSKRKSAGEKSAKRSESPKKNVSADKAEKRIISKPSNPTEAAPTTAKTPLASPKLEGSKRNSGIEKSEEPSTSPTQELSTGAAKKQSAANPCTPTEAPPATARKPLASPKLSQNKRISAGKKDAKRPASPKKNLSTGKPEKEITSKRGPDEAPTRAAKRPLASPKLSQSKRVSAGAKDAKRSASPTKNLSTDEAAKFIPTKPSQQQTVQSAPTEAAPQPAKKPLASPKPSQSKRVSAGEKTPKRTVSPKKNRSTGKEKTGNKAKPSQLQNLQSGPAETGAIPEKGTAKKPLASPKLSQSKRISASEKSAKPLVSSKQSPSSDGAENKPSAMPEKERLLRSGTAEATTMDVSRKAQQQPQPEGVKEAAASAQDKLPSVKVAATAREESGPKGQSSGLEDKHPVSAQTVQEEPAQLSVLMQQLALLEEEKQASSKRLLEEFRMREELELNAYKEKRKLLEAAAAQMLKTEVTKDDSSIQEEPGKYESSTMASF